MLGQAVQGYAGQANAIIDGYYNYGANTASQVIGGVGSVVGNIRDKIIDAPYVLTGAVNNSTGPLSSIRVPQGAQNWQGSRSMPGWVLPALVGGALLLFLVEA